MLSKLPAVPKISIVTPSFNQGEFIKQTIDSVLAQDYPNFEHIVVDGGSTDNTLEILRSYPHLKWTSAPDRGQTHALNLGFARATGDIVAWLNSDDWYAPQIFGKIAQALQTNAAIVGECDITNRQGVADYRVLNSDRSWFDILKWWVPYSIPTQPAIFFRRDVLEQFRRSDGKYLDEDLYFCMDFDLWLRIFSKYKFVRVPEVFSYYRMYEDNKTGQGMSSAEPEMSRVFKRFEASRYQAGLSFSVIVPLTGSTSRVAAVFENLKEQKLKDFELVFLDYSQQPQVKQELKQFINSLSKEDRLWVRYLKAESSDLATALNDSFSSYNGKYLLHLELDSKCGPEYLLQLANHFNSDRNGLVLPLAQDAALLQALINPADVMPNSSAPFNFAIRKVALEDLGGFLPTGGSFSTLKALVQRTITRAWQIQLV